MMDVAVAACLLLVSNAKAALLLDWQNGSLTTQATGVSGAATIPYFIVAENGQPSKMNGKSITVMLTAAPGYNVNGLTATFTISSLVNLTSITIGGQTFGSTGGTLSSPISLGDVLAGNTASVTFTLSDAVGSPGKHSLTFSDIQFNGTVTPVPEPVNVALGVFGICAVGVGVGRRVCHRKGARKRFACLFPVGHHSRAERRARCCGSSLAT